MLKLPSPWLIHDAAERGESRRVEMYLRQGQDLEAPDPRGAGYFARTPLHWACLGGHLETVQFLMEQGANIEARDASGATPLCRVLSPLGGRAYAPLALVDDGSGGPPEMVKARADWRTRVTIAQRLIAAGADVKAGGECGETPLHRAAKANLVDVARLLLERGADLEARMITSRAAGGEWTPLAVAAGGGLVEMVTYLLDCGAEVNPETGMPPLTAVVATWPNAFPSPALLVANPRMPSGHLIVAQLLLDRGARLEARDAEGKTALHVGVQAAGWHEGFAKGEDGSLLMLRLLLENGADAQAETRDGRRPLGMATRSDLIRVLEDYGADPRRCRPGSNLPDYQALAPALLRGCPAYCYAFGTGHGIIGVDSDTGLPVRQLGNQIVGPLLQQARAHHLALSDWIQDRGLPWNSRRSWLEPIRDPSAFFAGEAAQGRTRRLRLEGVPVVSRDTQTLLRLVAREEEQGRWVELELVSTKLYPKPSFGSLYDYQEAAALAWAALDPPPVLGQRWTEQPETRALRLPALVPGKEPEMAWGPEGSELVFLKVWGTSEGSELGDWSYDILDLSLGEFWKESSLRRHFEQGDAAMGI